MVYGDVPQNGIADVAKFRFPRGVILNKNLNEVLPVDPDRSGRRFRRRSPIPGISTPTARRRCIPGTASPSPTTPGPKPPYKQLDENKAYSWLKAPRWKGNAMEVGPLARMLVGLCQRAQPITRKW